MSLWTFIVVMGPLLGCVPEASQPSYEGSAEVFAATEGSDPLPLREGILEIVGVLTTSRSGVEGIHEERYFDVSGDWICTLVWNVASTEATENCPGCGVQWMVSLSGGYDLGQGCGLEHTQTRDDIGLGLGNKGVLYVSEDGDVKWTHVGTWDEMDGGWVHYRFEPLDSGPP